MSIRSVILATAALCSYTNAHMIMKSPVPYSVDKLDNAPITADQYPCKSNLGFTVSTMNSMAVGEKQTLSFTGSAVHGGGSCQLSVTTDTEPTKDSKFKVIKSIEGGCPGVEGPEDFDFELPDSIPNGKATFAWTWFAKLSGGPEMYMNCAPIEVTGGASDNSKFDALPDMLVANIATSTCKSPTSKALKFPNPGSVLAKGDDGSDLDDPTGDCGATGTTPSDPSSPAGGSASAAPTSPAGGEASAAPSSAAGGGNDGQYTPPASAATSAAATSAAATAAPSAAPTSAAGGEVSAAPSAASSAIGGVFAPGASSAAPVASTQTTLVTVTGTPAASPAQSTVPAAGTGTTPAQPTTPASSGDGTCSEDGAIVCNGESQFGLCNQGKVVWQAVAAGTTCSNGTITKRGYNGRLARPRRSFYGHVHKH